MHQTSLVSALAVALLACAGCQNQQQIQLVSALATTQASVATSQQQSRTEFNLNDIIIVFAYVTWPNVADGIGKHEADWQWFRNDQLVSHSHNAVTLNTAPAQLWTRRPAIALGAGAYRVETLLDGQIIATNSFTITNRTAAALYDKVSADRICTVPRTAGTPGLQSLTHTSPIYPPAAIETGTQGCAVIAVTLTQNGQPADAQIVAEYPAGSGFGEAARTAAENATFPPGHAGLHHTEKVAFTLAP